MELWRLFAHNHWFTININGYAVRLCARCSGYFLGITISYLQVGHLSEPLRFMNFNVQGLIYIVFAVPLIFDWISQSWGLRTSNNYIRLGTGILMGIDVYLFLIFNINSQMEGYLFVSAALIIFIIGHIGKTARRVSHTCA